VCRYAVAFHEVIKNSIFMYKDLYYSRSPLLEKITDSDHFPFNQAVIDEFRVQLGLLIDILGDLFQQHYAGPTGASVRLGKRRSPWDAKETLKRSASVSETFVFSLDSDTESVEKLLAEVGHQIQLEKDTNSNLEMVDQEDKIQQH